VKIGEGMASQAHATKMSPAMLHPAILFRVGRAKLRARMARRPMLPRDLWRLRALVALGTDTHIYKDQLTYYWGQVPYEIYGASEVMPIAINSWNKKWLTLVPDMAFYEFIALDEREKAQAESLTPQTVLTDQLQVGKSYELVLTQFYGQPLLRYRIGDIISVAATEDREANIALPQIVFKSTISGLIDLAGLARLDEKTLWAAISASGVKYEEWSARKEYDHNQTYVHIYIEPKEKTEPGNLAAVIDQKLREIDVDYRDIGDQLGVQAARVTVLAPGTFQRYFREQQEKGADLAHLKPPHMNTSDGIIDRLISLSREGKTK
jgi:hypothetical protein